MPTPHIEAPDGAFAPTVLMPGDPLRAKFIAENHLDDAEQVTGVRNMLGFTGTHEGHRISVMASGMGMPSAAIYVTELFRSYDVQRIIRIGTAGVYQPDLKVRQIVVADAATTNSNMPGLLDGPASPIPANAELLATCLGEAATLEIDVVTGTVFTSDIFYEPDDDMRLAQTAQGVLAVEMETAAIYTIAALEQRQALSIVTMSDHLVTGERMTTEERQTSLTEMIRLGIATAKAAEETT